MTSTYEYVDVDGEQYVLGDVDACIRDDIESVAGDEATEMFTAYVDWPRMIAAHKIDWREYDMDLPNPDYDSELDDPEDATVTRTLWKKG